MKNLLLIFSLLFYYTNIILSQDFNFNNGTDQDWYLSGPFNENGDGPFSSNFSELGWVDSSNYPYDNGTDPIGDNNGSICFYCDYSGHGISDAEGDFWIMQFHSPNLSSIEAWQNSSGYHVQIYQNIGTIWANLFVTVYDYDLSTERYFYNGTAQSVSSGSWQYFSFTDMKSIEGFPTNYSVEKIHVNIWGEMSGNYSGSVYLDDVIPVKIDDIKNMKLPQSEQLILYQNYPNPFNSETMIRYRISRVGLVRLKIYNVFGVQIRTLVNEIQNRGTFNLKWDGLDDKGYSVPSGLYLYKIETTAYKSVKKLMIIR